MKRLLGLFMVIILSGSVACAQGNAKNNRKDRKARVERDSTSRFDRMATALKLDEKQMAELKKLNETYADKAKTEREKQREQMLAMREERNTEMKKILTDEQYQEYVKMQEQRGNKLKEDKGRQFTSKNQRHQRDRRR